MNHERAAHLRIVIVKIRRLNFATCPRHLVFSLQAVIVQPLSASAASGTRMMQASKFRELRIAVAQLLLVKTQLSAALCDQNGAFSLRSAVWRPKGELQPR